MSQPTSKNDINVKSRHKSRRFVDVDICANYFSRRGSHRRGSHRRRRRDKITNGSAGPNSRPSGQPLWLLPMINHALPSAAMVPSTSRTIELTMPPQDRATNKSYGTITGPDAMLWSCNCNAGKGIAAGATMYIAALSSGDVSAGVHNIRTNKHTTSPDHH